MAKTLKSLREKVIDLSDYLKIHLKNLNSLAKIVLLITGLILLAYIFILAYQINAIWVFLIIGIICFSIFIKGVLFNLVLSKAKYFPSFFRFSLLITIPILYIVVNYNKLILALVFGLIVLASFLLNIFLNNNLSGASRIKKGFFYLGLLSFIIVLSGAIYFYLIPGFTSLKLKNAAQLSPIAITSSELNSPANTGRYNIKTLNYGSGLDKHRDAFGEETDIKTQQFNSEKFIDGWSGISGWWRTKYWDFSPSSIPLNARVWYPDAEGSFPLVLIVHGDHPMQDFSDEGYAYLGELLASRGYIFVSVDQNFLNVMWTYAWGSLYKENDARAMLLLEHLQLWHNWNQNPKSVFYNKIDSDNIALIGHSRGGEAIAHAALFNKLNHYPDDASIKLDYNYNIKSLISLAPVDGQYQPSKTKTTLRDINYLSLHGSHDGEVRSFDGIKQYQRISFQDSVYNFKSGVYIYGANHGQFNTTWGQKDSFSPFQGLLNLENLLSEEDQRKIAKVYISAFLDATLKDDKRYLPLFYDYRYGNNWLPNTIYLSQFEDSNTNYICTFEEDFDVNTSSIEEGKISSENVSIWREESIGLKSGKKGSKACVIGWNMLEENKKGVPVYSIEFSNPVSLVDSNSVFVFSAAKLNEIGKLIPKEKIAFNTKNDILSDFSRSSYKAKSNSATNTFIDFSIVFIDDNEEFIRFSLSDYSYLQDEIKVSISKTDFVKGITESEKIFQTFMFPLSKIDKKNFKFDRSRIKSIHFVFDKTPKGTVMFDDIGFISDFSDY